MRWVVSLVLCCGCAIGSVGRDGTLRGYAVGHAKLEYCSNSPSAGPVSAALTPQACQRIEGGALSNTFEELVATLIAAAATSYASYEAAK